MCCGSLSSSVTAPDSIQTQGDHDQLTSSDESLEEPLTSTSQMVSSETFTKRGWKNFITPKLVEALDRCQLVEALDLSCGDFPINKSSIQLIRTQSRKDRAESVKSDFLNNVPEIVTVQWDGKLLPGLDVRSSKEER